MNTIAPAPEDIALVHRRARWLLVGRSPQWCEAAREFYAQDLGAMHRWRVRTGHVAVVQVEGLAQALRQALAQSPARLTVACEPGLMQALDVALMGELAQHLAPPTGAALRLSEQSAPFQALLYNLLMPEPVLVHLWLHKPDQSWRQLALAQLQALPGTNVPVAVAVTPEAVQAAEAALAAWEEELAPVFGAEERAACQADEPSLAEQPLPGDDDVQPLLLTSLQALIHVEPATQPADLGLMRAAGAVTAFPHPAWRGRLQGLDYRIELRGAEVHAQLDAAALALKRQPEVGAAVALTLQPAAGMAIVLRGTWQQVSDDAGVQRPVAEFKRGKLSPAQQQALRAAVAGMRMAVTM